MPKPTLRPQRKIKDRVLQARIPEQLDDELRDRAEQLGMSVSTVVRNVLLNTFNLVEGVVADSAKLARNIQGHGVPSHAAGENETAVAVIGWHEAVLNQNGVCDQCNDILSKGERAAIGVPTPVRPILLCLTCLSNLTGEPS